MITASTVTDEKGNKVNTWKTSKDLSWRLIHDGRNVLAVFQSEGITETRNTIFEGETKADCISEIERLGLQDPNGVLSADITQQLKDAYAQLKQGREQPLDFAATVLQEAGITDLTEITTGLSAKRGIPIKTR